jgi:hypothetical protein
LKCRFGSADSPRANPSFPHPSTIPSARLCLHLDFGGTRLGVRDVSALARAAGRVSTSVGLY